MSKKETANKKLAAQQLLTILFPDYRIMFTPKSIILHIDLLVKELRIVPLGMSSIIIPFIFLINFLHNYPFRF